MLLEVCSSRMLSEETSVIAEAVHCRSSACLADFFLQAAPDEILNLISSNGATKFFFFLSSDSTAQGLRIDGTPVCIRCFVAALVFRPEFKFVLVAHDVARGNRLLF